MAVALFSFHYLLFFFKNFNTTKYILSIYNGRRGESRKKTGVCFFLSNFNANTFYGPYFFNYIIGENSWALSEVEVSVEI